MTESKPKNDPSPMIGAREAAAISGLSKRTIIRMCASKELLAVKLRNRWLINRDSFMSKLGLA